MEDGNAACATTTTSREEPNASDAKNPRIQRITMESQNTSDKWKTKRQKRSWPDKMPRTNQELSSTNKLITQWLKSMASSNKIPWETGLANDASTTTTLSESNATCATSLTLKAIECFTPKLNKE